MEGNVVLTMRDISKTFPGVKALQHVDFTLRKGEIHALMGENGAGKSTLIKVLTGVHEFENGEIRLDGKDGPIINKSPQDAQNNGISTVYQEVNLCPNLTVAENLFIGREPRKAGFIDWRTMNKRATELLKSLEIDASATQKLEEVSLARQQMIAENIAKKEEEERIAREKAEQEAREQAEREAREAYVRANQELMASIIYCEAGNQPYEGQVAVGAVIMNRVKSGSYPNSIEEVIYQSGQFGPAATGWLNRVRSSKGYSQTALQAAVDALNGSNPIGSCLYFDQGGSGMKIGAHYFH